VKKSVSQLLLYLKNNEYGFIVKSDENRQIISNEKTPRREKIREIMFRANSRVWKYLKPKMKAELRYFIVVIIHP
jgi:hypothetical protein